MLCNFSLYLQNIHIGTQFSSLLCNGMCISLILCCGKLNSFEFLNYHGLQVPQFEKIHGLRPCMVAPTKIIAGLGLSLGIDILEAPGATGDYRTLLTSKATAIAKALSAPLQSCPSVFVPGEDEHKPGRADGYDFGFLHIKVLICVCVCVSLSLHAHYCIWGSMCTLFDSESTMNFHLY